MPASWSNVSLYVVGAPRALTLQSSVCPTERETLCLARAQIYTSRVHCDTLFLPQPTCVARVHILRYKMNMCHLLTLIIARTTRSQRPLGALCTTCVDASSSSSVSLPIVPPLRPPPPSPLPSLCHSSPPPPSVCRVLWCVCGGGVTVFYIFHVHGVPRDKTHTLQKPEFVSVSVSVSVSATFPFFVFLSLPLSLSLSLCLSLCLSLYVCMYTFMHMLLYVFTDTLQSGIACPPQKLED